MAGEEGSQSPEGDEQGPDGTEEEIETWHPDRDDPDQDAQTPPASNPEREQARRGQPTPAGSGPPEPSAASQSRGGQSDAQNWAVGAHLSAFVSLLGIPSVVGPLVVWLVKRDEHPFVEHQAREALNFQISVLIYAIVGAIAAFVFVIATVGLGVLVVIPVVLVFLLGVFVLPIVAAVKASNGDRYRYPLTLRLVSAPSRHQRAVAR